MRGAAGRRSLFWGDELLLRGAIRYCSIEGQEGGRQKALSWGAAAARGYIDSRGMEYTTRLILAYRIVLRVRAALQYSYCTRTSREELPYSTVLVPESSIP